MLRVVDRLFAWVRSKPFFYRFALFTRILLVAGFVPTGLVKLMGQRFTTMSTETPLGAFFEAMFQTGLYWRFLGVSQVLAALLLLVPRFAHLGAAVFLPIMVNIFVITISFDFHWTPLVTGLMVFAATFLCFWDYHRFRSILTTEAVDTAVPDHRLDRWEAVGFTIFGLAMVHFFGITRSLFSGDLARVSIVIGGAAGFLTLTRFLWIARRGPA